MIYYDLLCFVINLYSLSNRNLPKYQLPTMSSWTSRGSEPPWPWIQHPQPQVLWQNGSFHLLAVCSILGYCPLTRWENPKSSVLSGCVWKVIIRLYQTCQALRLCNGHVDINQHFFGPTPKSIAWSRYTGRVQFGQLGIILCCFHQTKTCEKASPPIETILGTHIHTNFDEIPSTVLELL